MSLYVDIKKRINEFSLNIGFECGNYVTGLLGTSGSGKSMTLKCIAGIEKPDKGIIVLNDKILFDSKKKINLLPQKRSTGYLFQNYALFPNMTVNQNISICLFKNESKQTSHLLKTFCLEGLENHYPHQLSGGQQQRVALARIMAQKPEILMLDEPFSALDSCLRWKLEREIMDILDMYNKSTLFVSHSRDEVYRLCSEMAVISNGKVDNYGSKDEIFNNPQTVETAKLTGCKNISRVKIIDENIVEAVDWGVTLTVNKQNIEQITYLGIRANHFSMAEQNIENSIPCKVIKTIESPFTVSVFFQTKSGSEKSLICWEVEKQYWQKIKSKVRYISVLPSNILLLKN